MSNGNGNNGVNWTTLGMGVLGFLTLLVNINCNQERTRERQEAVEKKVVQRAEEVKDALDDQARKNEKTKDIQDVSTAANLDSVILYLQRVVDDPDTLPEHRKLAREGLAKAKQASAELKSKNGKLP